jgi:hypothetical protein
MRQFLVETDLAGGAALPPLIIIAFENQQPNK